MQSLSWVLYAREHEGWAHSVLRRRLDWLHRYSDLANWLVRQISCGNSLWWREQSGRTVLGNFLAKVHRRMPPHPKVWERLSNSRPRRQESRQVRSRKRRWYRDCKTALCSWARHARQLHIWRHDKLAGAKWKLLFPTAQWKFIKSHRVRWSKSRWLRLREWWHSLQRHFRLRTHPSSRSYTASLLRHRE